MTNKWRNEDFNRWSDEEIRRFRAQGYDQPRQHSQDYSGAAQYGGDSDYRGERDWRRRERLRRRSAPPDWDNQFVQEDFAQPGTFYYGGTPQRRLGLGPVETTYESEATPDYDYGYGGASYVADRARIDSAYRDMAAFERDMMHDHDEPYRERSGRGLFHDDPNRGPIDRLRNWMNHRGKGPKGYTRSDERIREDINDHLTQDYAVDATNIEVAVADCECTLNGSVATREEKRRAEDIVERVMGVRHVQNNLRVAPTATSPLSTQDRTGTMSTTVGSNPTLSSSRTNKTY